MRRAPSGLWRPTSSAPGTRPCSTTRTRRTPAGATQDDILALTATIPGIDVDKVKALIADKTNNFDNAMQADANEGYSMGVGGTPSFLIGKQMMVGAQPCEKLKAAIDAELASAG